MNTSANMDIYGNEISDEIKFLKTDFWGAIIAGELIALLSLLVLKNVGFFGLAILEGSGSVYLFLALWLIFIPIVSVSGLYFSYRLSIYKWPIIFKIGKYGIIGGLNTFLSMGILNFFILVTGVATGWLIDVFLAIAFATTITHSFFWQKFWTFGANNTNNGKTEYIRFFTVTTTTSLLNLFLLHIIINTIGAPDGIDPKIWANIAFAILIPIAFLGNFFGYKIFVFKKLEIK